MFPYMLLQFFNTVTDNLNPVMRYAQAQPIIRYTLPLVLGAIIFMSEHGGSVEVCKVQSLLRKNRSEAFVISAYAAVGGFVFRYHSDHSFSGLLTLSAALQSLCMALLLVAVTRGARRVSREAVALMALALGCRLYCSARYNGYLPTDRSGDGPLQAIDALSLGICLILFIALPREALDNSVHRKRMPEDSPESKLEALVCPKAPSPRTVAPRADPAPSTSSLQGQAFPTFLSQGQLDGDAASQKIKIQSVEGEISDVQAPCLPAHTLVAMSAVLGLVVHPNLLQDFTGDTVWSAGQFFDCVAMLPQLQLANRSGKEPWHPSFFGLLLLARITAFPFWVAVRPELDRIGGGAFNLSGSLIIFAQLFHFSSVVLFASISRCCRSSTSQRLTTATTS